MEYTKDQLIEIFPDMPDAIAANTPGGIFVYSAEEDDQFVYVSRNMLDMLGYTREEFRKKFGNRFSMMVCQEDRSRVLHEISMQIHGNGDYDTCEYRIEKKDGAMIWVHDEGHFIIDGSGKGWFYVIDTDITDSMAKKQEEARKHKELEDLVNNIPAGIAVYKNENGKPSYVASNSKICEILETNVRYLMSGDQAYFAARIHPGDRKNVTAELMKPLQSGCPNRFTFRYRTAENRYKWLRVEINPSFRQGGADEVFSVISDITKEKNAELELAESEHKYYQESLQSLLLTAEHSLCTVQMDLTSNLCGEAQGTSAYLIRKLESSTVDGFFEKCASFIGKKEDREHFIQSCRRDTFLKMFREGRKQVSAEFPVYTDSERVIYVRSIMNMISNPRNGHVEAVTFSRDITAAWYRRKVFSIVTEKEYDFIGILHLNRNKIEFLNVNPKLLPKYHEKMEPAGTLLDFDDIRHFAAANWIADEAREEYLRKSSAASIREALDQDGAFELTVPGYYTGHPDEVMCRKIQHYYLDERKEEVLLVELDVTEAYRQQLREARLAKAEARRVTDIMDSITSGISVLHMPDRDHLLLSYVNLQLFRLLGFTPAGKTPESSENADGGLAPRYFENAYTGVHPDDLERVRKTFCDNYDSDYFTVDSYRTMGGDGQYRWIQEEVKLREITPEYRVFYATYRDVSAEVKLQEELAKRLENERSLRLEADRANEMKTAFIANISHDMRTPLNAVLGYDRLALQSREAEEKDQYLVKIGSAGRTLLSLINDTLDLQKIENGTTSLKLVPVRLSDVMDHIATAVEPMMESRQIRFTIDTSRAFDAVVKADDMRIGEVFINLLSNAAKFTHTGGHVIVTLECSDIPDGTVAVKASVKDDGIGISESFLPKIYEPFSQERTKESADISGSGLGLSIVKRLLIMMGGTISVKSRLGEGTEFTVCLSFQRLADDTAVARKKETRHESLKGKKILLCEDNSMNQEIAAAILKSYGLNTDIVSTGKEGTEAFLSSKPGEYAAILMDIRMPEMDGYQATAEIRSSGRPDASVIPIIAMTADAYVDDVKRAIEAGMNAHLSKPIEPNAMFTVLERLIGRTNQ